MRVIALAALVPLVLATVLVGREPVALPAPAPAPEIPQVCRDALTTADHLHQATVDTLYTSADRIIAAGTNLQELRAIAAQLDGNGAYLSTLGPEYDSTVAACRQAVEEPPPPS